MNVRRSWRRILLWSVLAVSMAVLASPFFPRVVRKPYLQQASPTSVVVRWRTSMPVRSLVHYGRSPGKLDLRVATGDRAKDHGLLLQGLEAGTRYYYSVEAWPRFGWGKSTHSFVTPPAVGSVSPARVWVLGDPGTRWHEQKAVRDAFYRFSASHPADLLLTLGDNAYGNGSDGDFQRGFFNYYSAALGSMALWPALGNHDARSSNSDAQSGVYFDVFSLPTQGQCGGAMSGTEAYYSFDCANIHFVCLDSVSSDRSLQGPMLNWLKLDLAQNHQDWTIAFWHHPPYSKGSHNSDDDRDSGRRMREMRENALPILEGSGVDLVLCGHSHTYERSYLLDGHYGTSDTLNEALIVDRGDGRLDGSGAYLKPSPRAASHQGTVYVVAGSSGHTSPTEKVAHPAMCVSTNVSGSLILDFHGPRLDATFLDDAGVARDHFTILKKPAHGV